MKNAIPESLTLAVQTPDGQLPSLDVCKALYEAAQLAARQAAAERKEAFRAQLTSLLTQHREEEVGVLEMLKITSCTEPTIQAKEQHLAAIDLCLARLE